MRFLNEAIDVQQSLSHARMIEYMVTENVLEVKVTFVALASFLSLGT